MRPRVQDGQPLREGEAEAGAGVFARELAVELHEGLEKLLEVLRRDADAGVPDGEDDLALAGRDLEAEFAAARRELAGVAEQVDEDLLELALVGLDEADPLADLQRDLLRAQERRLLDQAQAGLAERPHLHFAGLELELARLDLAQVEDCR